MIEGEIILASSTGRMGEDNHSYILPRKSQDGKYKMIDDIVLDAGPLRLEYVTEEEVRIFWNINSVYDVTRLKPLGLMLPCRKKIPKLQRYNCSADMEYKKHKHGKAQLTERGSKSVTH